MDTLNTYKGKTADQWRALAEKALQERAESFERCDTDGFMSQWASGVMAQRYRLCALLAETKGLHEFTVAVDSEGNRIEAEIVKTKYGECYCLNDRDTERFGRRFIPMCYGRVWKALGLREEAALLPARVEGTPTGGCIVRDETNGRYTKMRTVEV